MATEPRLEPGREQSPDEWRIAARTETGILPQWILQHWATLTEARYTPLSELRLGRPVEVCEALITLHAVADEACSRLTERVDPALDQGFERKAWALLDEHGSLSRISAARIRIVPKTHFSPRGLTIRSLSRYLALSYETVDLRWRRVEADLPSPESIGGTRDYNVVLAPWPLSVDGQAFRPVEGRLRNMDTDQFGFFEFDPGSGLDRPRISGLMEAAHRQTPRIDAVVLPEAAVEPSDIDFLEGVLAEHDVALLFTGVRERSGRDDFGRNYLHLGVRGAGGWMAYRQEKHNRWCLDERQIRRYHLTRALDPTKQWWEAIDLPERSVQIIDVGMGATAAPLICEDLARLDEVNDVLRRVGPSIVLAVLLDGPQLPFRWPCRYASVLADDPGSAVLTLTSFGMAARSTPRGKPRSRVIAMWNDPTSGFHELDLARGASGILITASVGTKTGWTADGRRHENMPELVLSAVRQLRVSNGDL